MNDHIFPYWDDRLVPKTPHTASQTSLDDRDNVELYIVSEQEEKDLIEFLQSDDYKKWQEELASKANDTPTSRRFYGIVKVRKADLISPSEAELLHYYMDYGFSNIEDVIKEYGQEEMLREWYNNTNFTSEFTLHREDHYINHFDWDKEYEDVEVISEEQYNEYKKYSW